jgi:diaminohydroxyphosphoribosylaminopyrimidine deaminase/5-amino-6-(5-phosphoribosylamino)uracil reductase
LALNLAQKGFGLVSPNPMVGCVIVHNEQIIGESYHQEYGGPHAEVNAINAVSDLSLLRDSTVYVTLEPCSHYGKTPPCANLLIQHGVKKVVIACLDPNPLVTGKGVALLKAAGIEFEVGILENEALALNKRFITYHTRKRPYIILKWAMSKDGYMSHPDTKQISGHKAQLMLHQWRTQEDAFVIGTETLLIDNPQLNSRLAIGKNPIRVAIDFDLKSQNLPLHFYDQSQKTYLLNGRKESKEGEIEFLKIANKNPDSIVECLYQKSIQSIVIEGGQRLLNSFISAGLYDEIRIFKSKQLILNGGQLAPEIPEFNAAISDLETDDLLVYQNTKPNPA